MSLLHYIQPMIFQCEEKPCQISWMSCMSDVRARSFSILGILNACCTGTSYIRVLEFFWPWLISVLIWGFVFASLKRRDITQVCSCWADGPVPGRNGKLVGLCLTLMMLLYEVELFHWTFVTPPGAMITTKVEMAKEVSAALYKVNLHCPDCAHKIRKPLMRIQGVHSVDVNFEKSEVRVIGAIDAKKIHERIEKLSKKKVELIKVESKFKETVVVEKVVKEIKEPIIHTHTVKVHLHCEQCAADLRRSLLRHKGIYEVKPDMKAQHLIIEGVTEGEKLVKYIREKLHKHAEIVTSKEIIKKEEVKKEEKVAVEKSESGIKVIEAEEVKEVQEKLKTTNTPYVIHYVYAPQWFSDEDPNSCSIM